MDGINFCWSSSSTLSSSVPCFHPTRRKGLCSAAARSDARGAQSGCVACHRRERGSRAKRRGRCESPRKGRRKSSRLLRAASGDDAGRQRHVSSVRPGRRCEQREPLPAMQRRRRHRRELYVLSWLLSLCLFSLSQQRHREKERSTRKSVVAGVGRRGGEKKKIVKKLLADNASKLQNQSSHLFSSTSFSLPALSSSVPSSMLALRASSGLACGPSGRGNGSPSSTPPALLLAPRRRLQQQQQQRVQQVKQHQLQRCFATKKEDAAPKTARRKRKASATSTSSPSSSPSSSSSSAASAGTAAVNGSVVAAGGVSAAAASSSSSSSSSSSTSTLTSPPLPSSLSALSPPGSKPRPDKAELYLYRTDGRSCTRETVQGESRKRGNREKKNVERERSAATKDFFFFTWWRSRDPFEHTTLLLHFSYCFSRAF